MESRNKKRMTWQDAYYDGLLEEHQDFCEETQEIIDIWYEDENSELSKNRKKKRRRDIYDL